MDRSLYLQENRWILRIGSGGVLVLNICYEIWRKGKAIKFDGLFVEDCNKIYVNG